MSIKQKIYDHLYDQWYQKPTWIYVLLPFSYLYFIGSFFYQLLRRPHPGLSGTQIIGVGNIVAGGGGKTPMIIWLASYAQKAGYKVAVVSKGYRRHGQEDWVWVHSESDPMQVGDEPLMIHQKTGCLVVVAKDRWLGIQKASQEGARLILCDDGIQDSSIPYDQTLVMRKSEVGEGNGMGFPAGPLRQPKSASRLYSLMVHSGFSDDASPSLAWLHYQIGEILPLGHDGKFMGKKMHVVCGIAHPETFFSAMETLGYEVIPHAFPDHYAFTKADFQSLSGPIVMTEKDATKCQAFVDERFWFVPLKLCPNITLLAWAEKHLPLQS